MVKVILKNPVLILHSMKKKTTTLQLANAKRWNLTKDQTKFAEQLASLFTMCFFLCVILMFAVVIVSVWWIMVWAVQVHVLWLNSSVRAKLWRNCGECDLFKLLCLKKNKSQNYMLSLSLSHSG